eukprot:711303-Karenia_brevis.AAC.1
MGVLITNGLRLIITQLYIGVELDYQGVPDIDSSTANLVWKGEHVKMECPSHPPPWRPAVER